MDDFERITADLRRDKRDHLSMSPWKIVTTWLVILASCGLFWWGTVEAVIALLN